MTLSFLQILWWTIISLLGAVQFFALFALGAQSMLLQRHPLTERDKIAVQAAKDHDILIATMITYQLAACVLFPTFSVLVYGWLALDLAFLLPGLLLWLRKHTENEGVKKAYDIILTFCGFIGPFLLGSFVSCYFFGNVFTVTDKTHISETFQWGEIDDYSIFSDWRVLAFGLMLTFLSRIQANFWLLSKIDEADMKTWNRKQLRWNSALFTVAFIAAMYAIFTTVGYQVTGIDQFEAMEYKYLYNLLDLPAALACFLLGTIMLIAGMGLGISPLYQNKVHGGEKASIWHSGIGTILIMTALFMIAGFNDTPFFPSTIDMNSSLTIYNSSAPEETLRAAAFVMAVIFIYAGSKTGMVLWARKKENKS